MAGPQILSGAGEVVTGDPRMDKATQQEKKDVASIHAQEANAARASQATAITGEQRAADVSQSKSKAAEAAASFQQSTREKFYANPDVKTYFAGISNLHRAIDTPANKAGDNELLMTVAKSEDPAGVVTKSDQDRLAELTTRFNALRQHYMSEFGLQPGSFSPELRNQIRASIYGRVKGQQQAYQLARENMMPDVEVYNQTLSQSGGKNLITPDAVFGKDPAAIYGADLDKFSKRVGNTKETRGYFGESGVVPLFTPGAKGPAAAGAGEPAGEPDSANVPLFDQAPEGMSMVGHGIKAPRFDAQHASAVINYVRRPDATPEGFAHMVTDQAISQGLATEDSRATTYQANLDKAQKYFKDNNAAARSGVSSLDYTDADKASTLNAPISTKVGTAFSNIPTSLAGIATGGGHLITDAASSVMQGRPVGAVNVFAHPLDTLDAMTQKYRNADEFQRSLITDPLGIPADIAGLVSGGGAGLRIAGKLGTLGGAARFGSALGDFGSGMQNFSRNIDPLSAPLKMGSWLADPVGNRFTRGAGRAASSLLGGLTGVGDEPFGIAARTGYDAGRKGVRTAGLNALEANMADPGTHARDAASLAQGSLDNLRAHEGAAYEADTKPFFAGTANDRVDLTNVRQQLDDMKPVDYDRFAGLPDKDRPPTHLAWDRADKLLSDHMTMASSGHPSLLNPEQLDAFSGSVRDIVGFDPNNPTYTGSIERQLPNAIRQTIRDRYPQYGDIKDAYAAFLQEQEEMHRTFGLNKTFNDPVNLESTTRRLFGAMRNNANTNYGLRMGQAERLASLDPTGTLLPTLAGQSLSKWTPRSLQGPGLALGIAGGTGAALTGSGAGALAAIPAAMMMSPQLMGRLAKNAGRAAGVGVRGAGALADIVNTTLDRTKPLYNNPITRAIGLENPRDMAVVGRLLHDAGTDVSDDDQRQRWRLPDPMLAAP